VGGLIPESEITQVDADLPAVMLAQVTLATEVVILHSNLTPELAQQMFSGIKVIQYPYIIHGVRIVTLRSPSYNFHF
jgi:hypothetical protein